MTSSKIAFGYGAGCVGCAARRSPSCQVGRRRMGITLCAADNKPGTRSAPTAPDGSRPRLSARIPRECPIPARYVDGPVADWSVSGVAQRLGSADSRGRFCRRPPSLPGIGRQPVVFCSWRQTPHELAGSGLTQTANLAVGLLTRTRVEASPTVGRWPAAGSVSPTSRSSTQFSGRSQQEPVLLLRVRPRG
jgi:hypothetical protein